MKNVYRVLAISLVAVAILGFALTSTVSAIHTQGHFRHEMRDWPTGWLMGSLDYYVEVDSTYTGGKYMLDDADHAVSTYANIGHYYINIEKTLTKYYGSSNEYAKGFCEWDNGYGILTPWGWIPIQQWHHSVFLWVYGSGSWNYQFY